MPQLNENTPSNIHFFLDRTTATHPIEHHLVVRNTHHAAEANQSVSSPNEETFQAPERDGLSVHVLNQENLTDPDNSCFAVTGSPLMGGASSPLRVNRVDFPMSALRPLMLQERRQSGHSKASRSCEELTRSASFDQLVAAEQERLRMVRPIAFAVLRLTHMRPSGPTPTLLTYSVAVAHCQFTVLGCLGLLC